MFLESHFPPTHPRHSLVVTLLANEYVLVEKAVRRLHAQVRQTRAFREVPTTRIHWDLSHLKTDLDWTAAGVVALLNLGVRESDELYAEATVDFCAFGNGVLDDALDELGSALVVELTAAYHDGPDAVVVEPLHVVVHVRLEMKRSDMGYREAHKSLHVFV